MKDDLELTPEQRAWAQEVVRKAGEIRSAIKRVVPDASDEVLEVLPIDLGDFWEIAENHKRRISELVKLSGPEDRQRLSELLTELWYRDISAHLPSHLRSMRKTLPRFLDSIDAGEQE